MGLSLNPTKTKYLAYNIPEPITLMTRGVELERKWDFKYLGSWVDNTEADVRVRKAMAWRAFNEMQIILGRKLRAKKMLINRFSLHPSWN